MKIYFNRRPTPGPWGGGSKVLSSIVDESLRRNHQVYFEEELIKIEKFDIYFCMDPRPNQKVTYADILEKRQKCIGSKLVQRVGDLGTHGKPELFELVKKTSETSDFLIFPSEWARQYLGIEHKKSCVIHNAPLADFFLKEEKKDPIPENGIKIVTHHWSNNSMKGFDLYKKLDEFCKSLDERYKFLFVGRKPDEIDFKNHLGPQDVLGLVKILPQNHIYVTASKKEAGANHVLEAMAMGLPILYHEDGGSINEYCEKFGIPYKDFDDLKDILLKRMDHIKKIRDAMIYNRNSFDMSKEYIDILEELNNEAKH